MTHLQKQTFFCTLPSFQLRPFQHSWHSCGTDNAGLDGHCGQKQRKPALHELVKPYLDGLILIRDVEAGGSNPLTPTKDPLLLRGDVSLTDSFRSTVKV